MSIFERALDRVLLKNLNDVGQRIVVDAQSNSSWSSSIPKALEFSGVKKLGNTSYNATITIDLSVAPEAFAFEYGSGEHIGKGTYPIVAKQANALSFYWEKIGGQVLVPRGGGFPTHMGGPNLLIIGKGQVDHPGVAAKPYLEPAIENNKPNLGARLLEGLGIIDFGIDLETVTVEIGL